MPWTEGKRARPPERERGCSTATVCKHLIMQTPKPNKETLPLRTIKPQSLRLSQAASAYAALVIIRDPFVMHLYASSQSYLDTILLRVSFAVRRHHDHSGSYEGKH